MSAEYNATLVRKKLIAEGLVIMRVKPDETPFRFESGQYTVLGLYGREPRIWESEPEEAPGDPEKMIKRAYSISSGSTEETLEFYIVLVRTGALTPRLLSLGEGNRLWISAKAVGLFTLDSVPDEKDIILVSTGTGLAPYISMIRTNITTECGRNRRWGVLHGARHSWDLGYRSELSICRKNCPNFFYMPSITRPSDRDPWSGPIGRVNKLLTDGIFEEAYGEKLDPEKQHLFLCGNPGMVEDSIRFLRKRGFTEYHRRKNPDGQLHVERYW